MHIPTKTNNSLTPKIWNDSRGVLWSGISAIGTTGIGDESSSQRAQRRRRGRRRLEVECLGSRIKREERRRRANPSYLPTVQNSYCATHRSSAAVENCSPKRQRPVPTTSFAAHLNATNKTKRVQVATSLTSQLILVLPTEFGGSSVHIRPFPNCAHRPPYGGLSCGAEIPRK